MTALDEEIGAELARLAAAGLKRRLSRLDPGAADFTSNDVLGLSRDPDLAEAAARAARADGVGGRASRLLGGGSAEHEALEAEAASWLGSEAALFFPTGTHANLALVTSLARPGDLVCSDALNHASLIDACRLSRARVEVFPHLDLGVLERTLRRGRGGRRRLVVTESVFSMEGDAAPIPDLLALAAQHDAWVLLDEAHAAGLLGPQGAGLGREALDGPHADRLAARVVTGGKALGVGGALVAGSRKLVDLLVHRGRAFVFTTAPPPPMAGALRAAIARVRHEPERGERVVSLARRLALRLDLPEPAAAIVPVLLGTPERALEAERTCRREGFEVRAVRPPTVPDGASRVRVVVHHRTDEEEIDRLAALLLPFRRAALEDADPRRAPARRAALVAVTGTDTGVGKTVVSALLLRAMRRRGDAPRYWKPIQTGDEADRARVLRLSELDEEDSPAEAYLLPLPASPHEAARAAGVRIDLEAVSRTLERLRRERPRRPLVLEPAGGLLVPWNDETLFLDWIARHRPRVVLVARSGLGTLNHTLLSVEALRARTLEPAALFLVGPPQSSNERTLAERLLPVPVFALPLLEPLDTRRLDAWLDEHDVSEALP